MLKAVNNLLNEIVRRQTGTNLLHQANALLVRRTAALGLIEELCNARQARLASHREQEVPLRVEELTGHCQEERQRGRGEEGGALAQRRSV
eukprot:scaffold1827_cov421-Prasinococcus_capsulatus_cf.AAC.24